MPKPKKIRIIEKKLGRERAWGLCWQGCNLIEIDPRVPARRYLQTLTHELLHAVYKEKLSEHMVCKGARFISKGLWQMGFRRIAK